MTTACLFEKNHLEIKLFKGEEKRETQRETEREEREREGGGKEGEYYYNIPLEHNTHVIFTIL